MVRRHGWQYPAHTYQVVAITLFLSLAAIFYTLLSPFLGHTIKEYVAVGIFSPVALAVSFLYIRCTAIDPSDPGILATDVSRAAAAIKFDNCSQIISDKENLQSKIVDIEEGRKSGAKIQCFPLLGLFGVLKWLMKGDKCRLDGANREPVSHEDVLYCTLCDAEVYKFSKHCRSCDKCVEGFDHHCRWINNCIGRKNYVSFVALVAACLILLLVETISGLIVLVRCFTNKHEIRIHITNKLGNGFSMAPFSALVALCTFAPLLASIPLGELFFFHMLLIRKGITTYEYVIAMRARNGAQASAQVEKQTRPVQSGSNASDWRSPNSVGVPYYEAWCNPRRQEQQGEGIPRLDKKKLPCTVDTESATVVERTGYRSTRQVVKISALKLAKLNPKEASKAATRARDCSSTLRPVGGFHNFPTSDTDCGSSCSITPRSSISLDYGPASGRKGLRKEAENLIQANCSPKQETTEKERDVEVVSSRSRSPGSAPLSPLPVERRFGNPNVLRTSVQRMQMQDLGAAKHGLQVCSATILPHSSIEHPSWICTTPINEGHEISRGSETVQLGKSHIISVETHANVEKCGSSQTPVYWDRAAGRFRSLPNRNPGMKVSNLLPKTSLGSPWNPPGPHSILSPGRCLMNSKSDALRGSLNSSTPKNCDKENFMKVASNNSRSFSIHSHIVLPSQITNGSETFVCQSSTSACRTKPKNMVLSRFTPS